MTTAYPQLNLEDHTNVSLFFRGMLSPVREHLDYGIPRHWSLPWWIFRIYTPEKKNTWGPQPTHKKTRHPIGMVSLYHP